MYFKRLFLGFIALSTFVFSGCIMTKNPHYQTKTSYLDARYDQLLYLHQQKRLSKADYDEAYLLGTMYHDKQKLKEARDLLKISFENEHTLPAGIAYKNVLEELGERKEAKNVQELLTMLYAENEIQTQTSILKYQ